MPNADAGAYLLHDLTICALPQLNYQMLNGQHARILHMRVYTSIFALVSFGRVFLTSEYERTQLQRLQAHTEAEAKQER